MAENESSTKGKSKKLFMILGSVILLIILSGSIYFFLEYRKTQDLLKNPSLAAQNEARTLIAQISEVMVLPTDEEPTIATVSDVSKLQGQPFFKNAQNGYKVLIYPKAQKAILYDPVTKKIIESGPVNLNQTQSTTPTPEAKEITVALYNGSTTVGLTNTIEKQLKEKYPQVKVTQKVNAAKSNYTKTIVIDIDGNKKALATEIAKFLGGEVGLIPSGEAAPQQAEILVILGK